MFRLVEPKGSATGKRDLCDGAPALLFNLRAKDAFGGERGDLSLEIVAHEIKLVRAIVLRGMNRGLGRRQGEEKPAVPGVHGWKAENVAKKGAIRFSVLTEKNNVSARDHGLPPKNGFNGR